MVKEPIEIRKEIFNLLSQIPDPEIPVLNIVEMGIVRDAYIVNGKLKVNITPTYSGCPAMKPIEDDIVKLLEESGYQATEVNLVYYPPWTTDWLTHEAKQKLEECGIAPPQNTDESHDLNYQFTGILCPFCNSADTRLTSVFGSTSCKSLHYCNACQQPFEHFKCS